MALVIANAASANSSEQIRLLSTIVLILVASVFGCRQSTDTTSSSPAKPYRLNQTPQTATRTIVDMYGRRVTVPATIARVLTTGPIDMELVYMLAPDTLVGLNFPFNNGKPAFAREKYRSLPIVGGWFGTKTGNYETFMAAKPDIIIEGAEVYLKERQEKFGTIPVVGIYTGNINTGIAFGSLTEYRGAIRFLGELLNARANAESLIAYYDHATQYVVSTVSRIPDKDKVRFFYAEGKDGLSTDPAGSMHTRLLEFCGGKNVADVAQKPGIGMAETSLEQIILWDPDAIIIGRASGPNLYRNIRTDARWTELRAVKNGKVYRRPDNPFSWFDGPPGPCEIVGMYWMVNKLYPDKTRGLDLKGKVKEFYSKFFHYELTDKELATLLANPS
jgi:iron complex transport system substrate-binding protein